MMSKIINWSHFTHGKEFDASQLDQSLQGSGLKFVPTVKGLRFLARFVFQGKKVSKSLGSCAYPEFEDKLAALKSELDRFHRLINENRHPFEIEQPIIKPTISTFVHSIYLPNAKSRKKSYQDDESRLRIHILPIIGHLTWNEINTGTLSQLLSDLKHKKELSNATLNRIRALLSALFNMAIDYEFIDANPASRVKKFNENNQKERYLNDDELKALLQVLTHPTDYGIDNLVIVAIVKFLLLTGVRKREALDLKWCDVDTNTGAWLLGENKSGKARRIQLNQDALNIIRKMSRQSAYIFANPVTGIPFNDIRKTYDKIMLAAKIDNMRIHDLRHNFASLAVNSGQSLYVVQHLLGHASPQTTQRYAHLQTDTLLAASEQVAHIIKNAQAS
ncbi:tyrosine-type recombinase/integrase [Acinetobacter soli]|uniref:Tyr recombinase domain-containing protein n=1 Tax=Acinetobacter soli NIPH 2899 TaxID=1217677 RepID=A0ABN0JVT2_9GAMM|nr:site-specific integrase [Acinetobacter soli]ENV59711.1 hypothetical protein F950_02264 [Acinetobacter soli NIPH 2899]